MDHVNNAVYLDWIEEALAAADLGEAVATIPRRCRLEYRASAAAADHVAAAAWVDPVAGAWHVRIAREDGLEFVRASGTPLRGN
jgi:acyl-ACP thioesterase